MPRMKQGTHKCPPPHPPRWNPLPTVRGLGPGTALHTPGTTWYGTPFVVRCHALSCALQVLQAVQSRSKDVYPPGTIDNVEDFALRLLGAREDGAPDGPLLAMFIGQLTDGELSARVKVALLRCFTVFIDRVKPTGRELTSAEQQAALKDAQVRGRAPAVLVGRCKGAWL